MNQIEVHPFNTREDIREVCAKHGIVVEAYAPLARAYRMDDPTILEISERYGCTPAQLMVRYVVLNQSFTNLTFFMLPLLAHCGTDFMDLKCHLNVNNNDSQKNAFYLICFADVHADGLFSTG